MNILKKKIEMIMRILFNRNCILITYALEPKTKANVIVSTKYELHTDVQSLISATSFLKREKAYKIPKGFHIPKTEVGSNICNTCGKTVSEHYINCKIE